MDEHREREISEMISRTLLTATLLSVLAPAMRGQDSTAFSQVFQDGEWLQYKVKFGLFRLGTVQLHVSRIGNDDYGERFRIDLRIDSNPHLFFVNIHESHYNIVHAESLYSEEYYRFFIVDGDSIANTRRYDRKQRVCVMNNYNRTKNKLLMSFVLWDVGPYFEGPSMWLFARSKVQEGGSYKVQNILETSVCETSLSFKHVRSLLEIDAYEERIVARQVSGVANWVGNSFGGLNGEFRGWFSDDGAAIPLRAQFKLFVGDVVLELERWYRPGWTPPTAQTIAWRR